MCVLYASIPLELWLGYLQFATLPDPCIPIFSPGTPGFMAPEVLLGQPYDIQADIFSLGSLFYELAHSNAPFWYEMEDQYKQVPALTCCVNCKPGTTSPTHGIGKRCHGLVLTLHISGSHTKKNEVASN
jgi:serine/threonine protein kinase